MRPRISERFIETIFERGASLLVGGLAPRIKPWLRSRTVVKLCEPLDDALAGAHCGWRSRPAEIVLTIIPYPAGEATLTISPRRNRAMNGHVRLSDSLGALMLRRRLYQPARALQPGGDAGAARWWMRCGRPLRGRATRACFPMRQTAMPIW
jgi:hypothetical protein